MADQLHGDGHGLMKEQKDATKEAKGGTALAEFLFGPSRWQAGAVLLPGAGSRGRRSFLFNQIW